MRISAKARYGLAAMVSMAENCISKECITIISLSEQLKISKLYLEQVFSLLKRAELVISTKGSQGGYQLSRMPKDITVFDILSAVETGLFEKTEDTVSQGSENIERAMQETIFSILDDSIKDILVNISLENIVNQVKKYGNSENYMYYL